MKDQNEHTDAGSQAFSGSWAGLISGALLTVVLVPTMQWLDRGTVANSLETGVPNPLGVGLIVAFCLMSVLFMCFARRRLVSARTLLIWYVMFSVALPFCSVGIISPLFGSIQAAGRELFHREEPANTLHVYEWQSKAFFPHIPADDFDYFLKLRDFEFVQSEGVLDPRSVSLELIAPVRQFWDGMSVTPAQRQLYTQPPASLAMRWEARYPQFYAPDAGDARLSRWDGMRFRFVNTVSGFLGGLDRVLLARSDIPWPIWRPILLSWGLLLVLIILGTMFLAQLLYRDWTERENLPFPVVQAPLAFLEAQQEGQVASVFKNPFFLFGLGVSTLVLLLSGLAHYAIIELPLEGAVSFQRIDFRQIFVQHPFTLINNNILFLSPLMIGVAFLVHQDLLRGALWVFLSLQGVRLVTGLLEPSIRDAMGAAWPGNMMPYYPELGMGAVLVFGLVLLWRSRHAFAPRRCPEGGYFLPGLAGIGLLLSVLAIGGVVYWMGAQGIGGLGIVAVVLLWTFGAAIVLARCRTEGGLVGSGVTLPGSKAILPGVGWAAHLHADNVRTLAVNEWMSVATIPGLLAAQIEGLYMARRLRVKPGIVAVACALAFVVALGIGLVSYMILSYWYGGLRNDQLFYSGMAIGVWRMGGDLIYRQTQAQGLWIAMVVVGVLVMAAMLYARKRFPRFPVPPICLPLICLGTVAFQTSDQSLHPVYTAGPYVCFVWGPMLVAFLVKKFMLRFGRMDMYVRAIPAAWGLIAGQCLMIMIWNIYHVLVSPDNITIFTGVFY